MTRWLCQQAASMVDGGQVNQVRRPVTCRYVAAVPELSAGLPPIPGLPWESLSHRQVLAELAAVGWVPCGVGDWAVALRSPEGTVVARVLDIPYIARENSTAEILALKKAWARAAG
jgi:hypothetical protein